MVILKGEACFMTEKNNRSNMESVPHPIDGDKGATDVATRDVMRDVETPDMFISLRTDSVSVDYLKFSLSDTHRRIEYGGWSREVTIRELPVSDTLGAVNMR